MDYIKKLTFTIFFFISFVVNTAHSKTTKVIVFGDSLIAGYGLLKEDGFVNQLQNKINHSKINLKEDSKEKSVIEKYNCCIQS